MTATDRATDRQEKPGEVVDFASHTIWRNAAASGVCVPGLAGEAEAETRSGSRCVPSLAAENVPGGSEDSSGSEAPAWLDWDAR